MTVCKPVRGCLVGIGGYGRTWLRAFEELEQEGLAKLTAVVVRNPAKYADRVAELEARGVRCFARYEDALSERPFDFVGLCTPLHLHRPQTVAALDAGVPVLCEKSAAPTVQDVRAMAEAQERTGVPLDIAYPRQTDGTVIALQRALADGVVGRVRSVVVRAGWLRHEHYYQRSAWAGRVRDGDEWILDGPVHNPLAHYLYNALYFASPEPGRLAEPVRVRGELYRARPTIEGEDTACIEAHLDGGARVYFYGTLVTPDETYRRIRFDIRGEAGRVTYVVGQDEPVRVRRDDGSEVVIEPAGPDGSTRRCIERFARYLLGESDRLTSPIAESLKFARVSNGAFDSSGRVHPIPAEYVDRLEEPVAPDPAAGRPEGGTSLVYHLRGIVEAMTEAGDRPALFADIGLPWAKKTEPLDVRNYGHFPQRFEVSGPQQEAGRGR